nr:cell division topological specificity factor MinE [Clostridioides mangenotii]
MAVFDLFKAFSNDSRKSKSVAKERLKLVLVHDRVDCSPQLLDMIKSDILNVIANYAEIEESGLEIKMSKCRSELDDNPISALVANIPLKSIKERNM